MLKKIINSNYLKNFRKSFLKEILIQIETEKEDYCCNVWSYHTIFICWKDLKEVQENMNSVYLFYHIKNQKFNQNCGRVWFSENTDRISFLKECLNKFN